MSPRSPRQERHTRHLHQADNATTFTLVLKETEDQGNGSKPLPLNSILSREEKVCIYVCSGTLRLWCLRVHREGIDFSVRLECTALDKLRMSDWKVCQMEVRVITILDACVSFIFNNPAFPNLYSIQQQEHNSQDTGSSWVRTCCGTSAVDP